MGLRNGFVFSLAISLSLLAAAQNQQSVSRKTTAERLGYPANSRLLIIHAEDLGMAHSIDRATVDAIDHGWVTSGSILVPAPWFPEISLWARNHPHVDLGISLDLNSEWQAYRWRPISSQAAGSGLIDNDGYLPLTARYVALNATIEVVQWEARAQIDRALADKVNITHLDTHMLALLSNPQLFKIYWELGKQYKTPVMVPKNLIAERGVRLSATEFNVAGEQIEAEDVPIDRVIQMIPGTPQSQWLSTYEKMLSSLPPGVYQLNIHLGYKDDELKGMMEGYSVWGAQWRQNDFDVISSPAFQKFLKDQKFVLVSWKEIRKNPKKIDQ